MGNRSLRPMLHRPAAVNGSVRCRIPMPSFVPPVLAVRLCQLLYPMAGTRRDQRRRNFPDTCPRPARAIPAIIAPTRASPYRSPRITWRISARTPLVNARVTKASSAPRLEASCILANTVYLTLIGEVALPPEIVPGCPSGWHEVMHDSKRLIKDPVLSMRYPVAHIHVILMIRVEAADLLQGGASC